MRQSKSNVEVMLDILLRDFGYEVQGNRIIKRGIKGFTRDEVWGRCRDTFDAATQLCPIIADDGFTSRLVRIMRAE